MQLYSVGEVESVLAGLRQSKSTPIILCRNLKDDQKLPVSHLQNHIMHPASILTMEFYEIPPYTLHQLQIYIWRHGASLYYVILDYIQFKLTCTQPMQYNIPHMHANTYFHIHDHIQRVSHLMHPQQTQIYILLLSSKLHQQKNWLQLKFIIYFNSVSV